jgi:hypothetical protein
VQAMIRLPTNYQLDRSHPVLIYLDGNQGHIEGADLLHGILGKANFICASVDYSNEINPPRDEGLKHTQYVLELLAKHTRVDWDTLILCGISSAAYCVSEEYANDTGKLFTGLCLIIGGMELSATLVGDRAVLLVAGENDEDKASGGLSRLMVLQSCYDTLKRFQKNVQLHVQQGVGHACTEDGFGAVRKWIYTRVPRFRTFARWQARLDAATDEKLRTAYKKRLAATWLNLSPPPPMLPSPPEAPLEEEAETLEEVKETDPE